MKKLRYILPTIVLVLVLAVPIATPVAAAEVGDTIDVPVTIRDFHGVGWGGGDGYSAHPDFEDGIYGLELDIVESILSVGGKPVYYLGGSSTHGAAAFDQWYRDTANVNMTMNSSTLTFTYDGSNYVYDNSSFFPIDGLLFGNDGRSHNYHFTMEMHTSFTYQSGQIFSFTGDDDVWLFIDGQLVIDLGGVHGALPASIDLDTLGLTIGNTYAFDLFFAERHTTGSNFRATTNIELQQGLLILEPATASNVINTQHSVMATLSDGNGDPVPGVDVTFTVTGANSANGVVATDANGQATFSYIGINTGQDEIVATCTDLTGLNLTSNIALKDWTGGGGPIPSVPSMTEWGIIATIIILAALIPVALKRRLVFFTHR